MPSVYNPKRPAFTIAERTLIKRLYPKADKETLLAALPGRSWEGICCAAARFEVPRAIDTNISRRWSKAHIALLWEHYPEKGAAYVAELVGRPTRTVRGFASVIGCKRKWAANAQERAARRTPRATDWTPTDTARLLTLYPHGLRADLLSAFPGRTWNALKAEATKNGIGRAAPKHRPWLPQEVAVLQANYPVIGPRATAALLEGRTERTVRGQALHLNLSLPVRAKKPLVVVPPKVVATPVVAAIKPKEPTPRLGKTPNADAAKAKRVAEEKKAKTSNFTETLRKYDYGHPARMAYMLNAKNGGAAAQAAFWEVLKKQAA